MRIKELKFARKKDISRDIMKEMRLLRELRHDNINSFIGACVEPMRILLVTDYCAKGSLYDIIENEDIKLDDLFIASLVHDLIKVCPLVFRSIFAITASQCFDTLRFHYLLILMCYVFFYVSVLALLIVLLIELLIYSRTIKLIGRNNHRA